MKKTFTKKLSLNKTTVANLNAASMRSVKGGETFGHAPRCPDLIDDKTDFCTLATCVTCGVTCETCNTDCGQNTCQVTCNDLITG